MAGDRHGPTRLPAPPRPDHAGCRPARRPSRIPPTPGSATAPARIGAPCCDLPVACKIFGCCQQMPGGLPRSRCCHAQMARWRGHRSSVLPKTARVMPSDHSVLPDLILPPSSSSRGRAFGGITCRARRIHGGSATPRPMPAVPLPGRARDDIREAGSPALARLTTGPCRQTKGSQRERLPLRSARRPCFQVLCNFSRGHTGGARLRRRPSPRQIVPSTPSSLDPRRRRAHPASLMV